MAGQVVSNLNTGLPGRGGGLPYVRRVIEIKNETNKARVTYKGKETGDEDEVLNGYRTERLNAAGY